MSYTHADLHIFSAYRINDDGVNIYINTKGKYLKKLELSI